MKFDLIGLLALFIISILALAWLKKYSKKLNYHQKQKNNKNRKPTLGDREKGFVDDNSICDDSDSWEDISDEILIEKEPVSYKPKPILTKTEIAFFKILIEALPDYHIFSQVATEALLTIVSSNRSEWQSEHNRTKGTIIDYVICDSELNVKAIIELDDKSHDSKKEKDAARDERLKQAGYKTLRYDCRKGLPSVQPLRNALLKRITN